MNYDVPYYSWSRETRKVGLVLQLKSLANNQGPYSEQLCSRI